jgi:hypothetical protein
MRLRLVLKFGGEKEELNFFERFMDMNILQLDEYCPHFFHFAAISQDIGSHVFLPLLSESPTKVKAVSNRS